MNSMAVSLLLDFLGSEMSSRSGAMLCGIPRWWMKHSVSLQVMVLAEHYGQSRQIHV
jgi:hypothetical protein